ncbi:MAG: hypothetical protein FWE76_03015 [Symbiobacteriaceae bacterium]|nr:hypothetical protein [Symbiobacteriaceae bacterium]
MSTRPSLCLQNGLSAMKAEPLSFVGMMLSLLLPGGSAIISTYSEKFWQHRLAWFIKQADKGLLGEIDPKQSRDGINHITISGEPVRSTPYP